MAPVSGRLRREPPDLTYLTGLKSNLETMYAGDDERIDLMRKVRELEDPPVLDEALRVVDSTLQDPTITDEVARVVATLSMREPTWTVAPTDPETDPAQENSTKRERFTEALFHYCGTRVPGQSTFHILVDSVVADGGAVVKWVYNPERWEPVFQVGKTRPDDDKAYARAKRDAGPPMSRIPVDVRTWYPLWEGDRLVEVMEISERPFFPTLRQHELSYDERAGFGAGLGHPLSPEEARRYPATCEFWEHRDDTWVTYVAKTGNHATIVKQFEHGMGETGYFYAPGIVMNHHRGRKCAFGVGFNKLSLCRFRSYLLTLIIQAVARVSGSPIAIEQTVDNAAEALEGQAEEPSDDKEFEDIPLAKLIRLNTGERVNVIDLPGVPDATKEALAVVTRLIDDLNTPHPAPNFGGDLAGAGYAIQSMIAEGKTRHYPFVSSLERMHEEETYFAWRMITEKIGEPVAVRRQISRGKPATPGAQWMEITPEDLEEGVGVTVSIDPEPATSKIVDERYAGEMVERGFWGIDQAIAHVGGNPDEVRRSKEMDRFRNTPMYTSYKDRQLMRRLQQGELLEEQKMAVAQAGVLPGQDPMAAMLGWGQPMAPGGGGMPGGMPMGMPDPAALSVSPGGQGASIPAPSGGGPYLPSAGMQAGVMTPGAA